MRDLITHIATQTANAYTNYNCPDMPMPEQLVIWQQIYDCTLAALVSYHNAASAVRHELNTFISVN